MSRNRKFVCRVDENFASDDDRCLTFLPGERTMSFAIYAVGYLILIVGLCYLAHLMHIPQALHCGWWLIILAGIGIVTGVQNTRQKDPKLGRTIGWL